MQAQLAKIAKISAAEYLCEGYVLNVSENLKS